MGRAGLRCIVDQPSLLVGVLLGLAGRDARLGCGSCPCYAFAVLQPLILILLLVLLVVALGLPFLLGPDSRAPAIISYSLLGAYVAATIWATRAWWVLLPILVLVAWVVRWDRRAQTAPIMEAKLDAKGWSRMTRLRFRLWCAANLAIPALIVSLFVLPAGSAIAFVIPSMAIVLAAMALFRFSFYRSALRDYEAAPGPAAPASPAGSG